MCFSTSQHGGKRESFYISNSGCPVKRSTPFLASSRGGEGRKPFLRGKDEREKRSLFITFPRG